MSIFFRCDRCNAEIKDEIHSSQHILRIIGMPEKKIDLCPTCTRDYLKWSNQIMNLLGEKIDEEM